MNNTEAIAILRGRLAQAERRSEQLRRTGSQEQYRESCVLVGVLELKLDRALNDRINQPAT